MLAPFSAQSQTTAIQGASFGSGTSNVDVSPSLWVGVQFTIGNRSATIQSIGFTTQAVSGNMGDLELRESSGFLLRGSPGATLFSITPPNQIGINLSGSTLGALNGLTLNANSTYTLLFRNAGIARYRSFLPAASYTLDGEVTNVRTVITPNAGATWTEFSGSVGDFSLVLTYEQVQQLVEAIATEQSMSGNRNALRSTFALAANNLNPGLSHDCTTFGAKNFCVAFSGKYTSGARDVDATSGALTLAFKPWDGLRVGGFIEQRIGNVSDQGVRLRRGNPDVGLFGVWSQRGDALGTQVRVAYRHGKQDADITRSDVGGAEIGSGSSKISSQGLQITASHGVEVRENLVMRPYVGLRQIDIERAGYTESNAIASPLTYDALRYRATQVLAGVQLSSHLGERTRISGSLGIEHDASRSMGDYSASGVAGLGALDFGGTGPRTRPVLSLGLAHQVSKNQEISAQAMVRKEAWSGNTTRTAMVTYSVGF